MKHCLRSEAGVRPWDKKKKLDMLERKYRLNLLHTEFQTTETSGGKMI